METGLSLIQNNSNDCLIVASHSQQAIEFSAVDHFWQGRMCNQFSLQLVHPLVASKTIAAAGQPKVIHQIRGDGNCFFRTISFVITGSENYHQEVRALIVSHMSNIQDAVESYCLDPGTTLEQYLENSQMSICGTWATDVEIFVTAHLLATDICCYSPSATGFEMGHCWQNFFWKTFRCWVTNL